jgi:F0F1-type ATP synthase assembly protein I
MSMNASKKSRQAKPPTQAPAASESNYVQRLNATLRERTAALSKAHMDIEKLSKMFSKLSHDSAALAQRLRHNFVQGLAVGTILGAVIPVCIAFF